MARSQHGVVEAGEALWAVGGWQADGGLVSAVEHFVPADQAWQIVTHLPTLPRTGDCPVASANCRCRWLQWAERCRH
ncbi:MAG: hypothetical protein R2867_03560 [Caldilineaceae bacterium]